jgi:polygalacturonase
VSVSLGAVPMHYWGVAVLCLLFSQADASQIWETPWQPYPIIGARRFLVTEHGAIGDNRTMNTQPFRQAFGACAANGGGYVEVSHGVFVTGKVQLQSGCYLLLRKGAILQATTDISQYGTDDELYYMIVGNSIANSGIIALDPYGSRPGVAGGQLVGTMWQSIQSYNSSTNSFTKKAWPASKIGNLLFQDATNISVIGIQLVASSFWTQTFRRCRSVSYCLLAALDEITPA